MQTKLCYYCAIQIYYATQVAWSLLHRGQTDISINCTCQRILYSSISIQIAFSFLPNGLHPSFIHWRDQLAIVSCFFSLFITVADICSSLFYSDVATQWCGWVATYWLFLVAVLPLWIYILLWERTLCTLAFLTDRTSHIFHFHRNERASRCVRCGLREYMLQAHFDQCFNNDVCMRFRATSSKGRGGGGETLNKLTVPINSPVIIPMSERQRHRFFSTIDAGCYFFLIKKMCYGNV